MESILFLRHMTSNGSSDRQKMLSYGVGVYNVENFETISAYNFPQSYTVKPVLSVHSK